MMWCRVFLLAVLSVLSTDGFPEPGKWTLSINSSQEYTAIAKSLFAQTELRLRIKCLSPKVQQIKIGWVLRETKCWNEYLFLDKKQDRLPLYYDHPEQPTPDFLYPESCAKYDETPYTCDESIVLTVKKLSECIEGKNRNEKENDSGKNKSTLAAQMPDGTRPQFIVDHEGDYLLIVHIRGAPDSPFTATVNVEMKGPSGYLSVIDWPLLPFYGLMCIVYVLMGLAWLIVSARHWRDLLRIQFWIGGVIFMGMLEKAMFYAEFQNINSTGFQTKSIILMAEVISCAKRTLARMLVIIVSLGFGIVKPRLGPTLHRVVGIGGLYFVLAAVEACIRVIKPKNDLSSAGMMAGIPLAVIDSSICWWVFSALVQTTRTLRLRRNLVKLSLYRHFTNTLILAVMSSVFFMIWSIKSHRLEECLSEWEDLWVDEAFWHLLFSVILMVIMFLWTPSKNNQRYAFTPLLDNEEDEISEDEELFTDAFDGVKMRNAKSPKPAESPKNPEDDALKWIEENIPESENPLPVIDSEEELETTKFEISKMQ